MDQVELIQLVEMMAVEIVFLKPEVKHGAWCARRDRVVHDRVRSKI